MTVSTNIQNVTRAEAQIVRASERGEFGVCHFIDDKGGIVSVYTTTAAALAIAAAFKAAMPPAMCEAAE